MSASQLDFETLRGKSAPRLIAEYARRNPDDVAFCSKKLGLYCQRTWRDYATSVGRCALGFRALGLAKGDRVAIMGDACEEWVICDMAAQAAGAITFGIYPTASVSEVEFQMVDGGAGIFVAEDQEYVDKILQVADRLPNLKWIVVIDNSAMFDYRDGKIVALADVLKSVEQGGEECLAALEQMSLLLKAGDPAFIVYTASTSE